MKIGLFTARATFLVGAFFLRTLPVYPGDAKATFPQLRVEDFPALPPRVSAILRERKCVIPQPERNGPPRNVIEGEFFHKGQKGWAVLCARSGQSSILVFRDASDSNPEEIGKADDSHYVVQNADGEPVYLREISAVSRKFIFAHYNACGGPKPPPIDHSGIDDAFLEKASVTWYWYDGKWRQLSGAD